MAFIERRTVEEECRLMFGDFHVDTGSREWWMRQAMLERSRALNAERQNTSALQHGAWGRECAIVALRMVKRAGRLKAKTPDETKVLEWAEREPTMRQAGARKRLGTPDEHYAQTADVSAQVVLFDA